jgi:hypothetical protein
LKLSEKLAATEAITNALISNDKAAILNLLDSL